jgi:glycerophosphoryl diester phosphodiesterase
MLDTRRKVTGKISLVGHRGAPACAPENTLASFREGLAQGADVIELDVQRAADGHVVVFHDAQLDRTTDGYGPLVERTLAELKTLDAGSWFGPRFAGEPIPTLEEVLAWAKNRVSLFVELKHGAHADLALDAAVAEMILAHQMLDQVMAISFDHQALRRIKTHAPDLATAALYVVPPADPVALAREIGATAVMPFWQAVSAGDVEHCHDAGLAVHTWGSGADYPALIAAGVDAVNADHPAQVRRDFFQE